MNTISIQGGDVLQEYFEIKNNYGSKVAMGGTGLAYMSSSGNNTRCQLNDMSFMCKLSRTVSITSMVIYLLVLFAIVLYLLYILYKYVRAKK